MPTFTTNENGETVCNVSAFSAPNPSGDTGKIYSKVMPPQFKAVEHVGTYPGYEKAKAAAAHVSGKAGGAAIG